MMFLLQRNLYLIENSFILNSNLVGNEQFHGYIVVSRCLLVNGVIS
jgi:hypothetical protein